jgi:hypothetical protein
MPGRLVKWIGRTAGASFLNWKPDRSDLTASSLSADGVGAMGMWAMLFRCRSCPRPTRQRCAILGLRCPNAWFSTTVVGNRFRRADNPLVCCLNGRCDLPYRLDDQPIRSRSWCWAKREDSNRQSYGGLLRKFKGSSQGRRRKDRRSPRSGHRVPDGKSSRPGALITPKMLADHGHHVDLVNVGVRVQSMSPATNANGVINDGIDAVVGAFGR